MNHCWHVSCWGLFPYRFPWYSSKTRMHQNIPTPPCRYNHPRQYQKLDRCTPSMNVYSRNLSEMYLSSRYPYPPSQSHSATKSATESGTLQPTLKTKETTFSYHSGWNQNLLTIEFTKIHFFSLIISLLFFCAQKDQIGIRVAADVHLVTTRLFFLSPYAVFLLSQCNG